MATLTVINVGAPDDTHSTAHQTVPAAWKAVEEFAGSTYRIYATASGDLVTGTLTTPNTCGVQQASWYFIIRGEK